MYVCEDNSNGDDKLTMVMRDEEGRMIVVTSQEKKFIKRTFASSKQKPKQKRLTGQRSRFH
jgi:hypothetical protein